MENEPIINATALAQGEEKGGLCIVVYMCMAHTCIGITVYYWYTVDSLTRTTRSKFLQDDRLQL